MTQFRILDIGIMEDKYRNVLLQSLGHELKTPLNIMIGNLENAKELVVTCGADEDPDVLITIKQSITQAIYLQTIIEGFNFFVEIETGKFHVQRSEVDIQTEIDLVYSLLKAQIDFKNSNFESYIDPKIPKYVNTDMRIFRQTLLHLLANAVKFTHQGSIKISAKL